MNSPIKSTRCSEIEKGQCPFPGLVMNDCIGGIPMQFFFVVFCLMLEQGTDLKSALTVIRLV